MQVGGVTYITVNNCQRTGNQPVGGGSGGGSPAVGVLGTAGTWVGAVKVNTGMGCVFCGLPEVPESGVSVVCWSAHWRSGTSGLYFLVATGSGERIWCWDGGF